MMEIDGPPPPMMEIKLIFFPSKNAKNTKMPLTWSFFGTLRKVSTPLFWKLAANEFLLLYFFCNMPRRGEKNAKNGQKWSKMTKKKST